MALFVEQTYQEAVPDALFNGLLNRQKGRPRPSHGKKPRPHYGAPPKPKYGAPPKPKYGAPPKPKYGAPPKQKYRAPPPKGKYGPAPKKSHRPKKAHRRPIRTHKRPNKRPHKVVYKPRPKAPQKTYGAPKKAPQQTYGAPAKAKAPQQTYGAPAKAPQQTYGAPAKAPQQTYGAPAKAPQQTYGAPAKAPQLTYGPPSKAPEQSYGAPSKAPQNMYGSHSKAIQQKSKSSGTSFQTIPHSSEVYGPPKSDSITSYKGMTMTNDKDESSFGVYNDIFDNNMGNSVFQQEHQISADTPSDSYGFQSSNSYKNHKPDTKASGQSSRHSYERTEAPKPSYSAPPRKEVNPKPSYSAPPRKEVRNSKENLSITKKPVHFVSYNISYISYLPQTTRKPYFNRKTTRNVGQSYTTPKTSNTPSQIYQVVNQVKSNSAKTRRPSQLYGLPNGNSKENTQPTQNVGQSYTPPKKPSNTPSQTYTQVVNEVKPNSAQAQKPTQLYELPTRNIEQGISNNGASSSTNIYRSSSENSNQLTQSKAIPEEYLGSSFIDSFEMNSISQSGLAEEINHRPANSQDTFNSNKNNKLSELILAPSVRKSSSRSRETNEIFGSNLFVTNSFQPAVPVAQNKILSSNNNKNTTPNSITTSNLQNSHRSTEDFDDIFNSPDSDVSSLFNHQSFESIEIPSSELLPLDTTNINNDGSSSLQAKFPPFSNKK